MYINYHKHDDASNLIVPDVNVKIKDYCERAVELGQDVYFTTNHGWGGDIFESKTICDKYGLKCIYGAEAYIVKDNLQKDNSNYHIIIIPKTDNARKKFNLILTQANKEGYYYKPRISLKKMLECDKDDFFITTACVAGILRDEDSFNNIFLPLVEHYKENVFLEVQNHNHPTQIELNKQIIELKNKYNLKIIHANDSHYIKPEDTKDRDRLLEGKGISYTDENSFILDYPDEETIKRRYKIQGVLSEDLIDEALNNTMLLHDIDNLILDKTTIKMPNIYPNLTPDERIDLLKKIIAENFKKIANKENITIEEMPKYKQAIKEEMEVIEQTKEINTQDYFLLNYKLIHLAIDKYNGVLTTTSRGSAGAFFLNKCLGITELNRCNSQIPLYYQRFMSADRLLENHSLPDCDFNIATQEPFVQASKEILGENCCRPAIAYGTMQESEAFRNICRSMNIPFDEFNEVGKDLDKYRNDEKWKPIIDESQKFVGTKISASIHPCSYLLYDKNIEEEFGCIKVGDYMCVPMTSGELDEWHYLKNDYLVVSTVDLTKKVFDLIGIPRMSLKELENALDEKTWDIYANGLTCTVNQVDSDWATDLVKKYKPKNVFELANFTGCLRPGFDSYRDAFINREDFHNHAVQLDELFKSTNGFNIYQETEMQFFEYLGISPAKSISLIKKISKKKIKQEDFDNLTDTLKSNWILKIGSEKGFNETWKEMQSALSYSYNSPHALSMAFDSLYNAHLKAHYPLEYYTIVMDMYKDDEDRTKRLTKELDYFGIKLKPVKFGKSNSKYQLDREENAIYKSVSSIKYCNVNSADELYALSSNHYPDFPTLLADISKTSINSKQLTILILLDYFSAFGKSQKLLQYVSLFNKFKSAKQFSINKDYSVDFYDGMTYNINIDDLKAYCGKATDKQYKEFNGELFLKDMWQKLEDKDMPLNIKLFAQREYLGYLDYVNPKLEDVYYITKFETPYSKSKPQFEAYNLQNGTTLKSKVKDENLWTENNKFQLNSVIKVDLLTQQYKNKKENYSGNPDGWTKKEINQGYRWTKSDQKEWILKQWQLVKR